MALHPSSFAIGMTATDMLTCTSSEDRVLLGASVGREQGVAMWQRQLAGREPGSPRHVGMHGWVQRPGRCSAQAKASWPWESSALLAAAACPQQR